MECGPDASSKIVIYQIHFQLFNTDFFGANIERKIWP
jgi:hypothetical protein